jgi:putative tryptophan/tyrosine transport system ATP-binding protein
MLEIRHLSKTFRLDNNPLNDRQALKDLSLTIGDHDFIAVIGGNGSGKSTLLNIIAGSIKPDGGTLLLDGTPITKMSEYKRAKFIGRVFQDPLIGSIGDMSLEENLSLAARRGRSHGLRWHIRRNEREQYKALLIPLGLNLEGRLDQRMKAFSGGERQSITLLMASFNNPKLLLLDEHTAALDPKTAAKVMSFTDELVKKNGTPTLMITHNMKDAIRYGNRLIMMQEGKIVFDCGEEEKEKLTIDDLVEKFSQNSLDVDAEAVL